MIRVNGVEREWTATSVTALVATLALVPRGIAVAIDGEIVRRSAWDTPAVEDESSVEIVTAVAGG